MKSIDLNGLWDISYSREAILTDWLPDRDSYTGKMNVPEYWEDSPGSFDGIDCLRNPEYEEIDFSKYGTESPDSSLPFVHGTVYYQRNFDWDGESTCSLEVGGAFLECACFVNGRYAGYHLGHSTSFEFSIDRDMLKVGRNELVLAVSNLRDDRLGCIIRGFKGRSGGISGPVVMHGYRTSRIVDSRVELSTDCREVTCFVEVAGAGMACEWELIDPCSGEIKLAGRCDLASGENSFVFSRGDLRLWSDRDPALYRLRFAYEDAGACEFSRLVGFRRMVVDGTRLLLNGEAVFLRGGTEHAYYPETCNAPKDCETYEKMLRTIKSYSFNWLRFHTSVPNEAYMTAADKVGIMIQVEPPYGFGEEEWIDILKACRRHPSVVIYCAGNEELLDERLLGFLHYMRQLQQHYVPDGLFGPQEALRGIEYTWSKTDLGTPLSSSPFRHNPVRLEKLLGFSDVLAQYAWGNLSYNTSGGDWRLLDKRQAVYDKPILSHELGILSTYLDFSLRERYVGTRIGDRLFAPVETMLKAAGIWEFRDLYYRHSCLWARDLRKHCLETARHVKRLAGYDVLGIIDFHWHRHCYPCGMLNEFYELKAGDCIDDILEYNSPSVLLADFGNRFVYASGEKKSVCVTLSNYGGSIGAGSCLAWRFGESSGMRKIDEPIANGCLIDLHSFELPMPSVTSPEKVRFDVELLDADDEVRCRNHWDLWVFPRVELSLPEGFDDVVDATLLERVANGECLLVSGNGLRRLSMSFQSSTAGRMTGNLATVISNHPMLGDFPHEGYCSWQFKDMLNGGSAVDVGGFYPKGELPVLDVASSYKKPIRQSPLFEIAIGKGVIVFCGLKLLSEDPAGCWLMKCLRSYLASETCGKSAPRVEASALLAPVSDGNVGSSSTDMGFDARAQKKKVIPK